MADTIVTIAGLAKDVYQTWEKVKDVETYIGDLQDNVKLIAKEFEDVKQLKSVRLTPELKDQLSTVLKDVKDFKKKYDGQNTCCLMIGTDENEKQAVRLRGRLKECYDALRGQIVKWNNRIAKDTEGKVDLLIELYRKQNFEDDNKFKKVFVHCWIHHLVCLTLGVRRKWRENARRMGAKWSR